MLTSCWDQSVRVYDARTGTLVFPPLHHDRHLFHAEFSPDGRLIVCASGALGAEGEARLRDAATGRPMGTALKHKGSVRYASFSRDSARIVTASDDGTARVWDTAGRPLSTPLMHVNTVRIAHFSPDGRRVVTGSEDGTTRVWDAVTSEPLTPPMKHPGKVYAAEFSPDGRIICSVSDEDRTPRLWDAATGQPLAPALWHTGACGVPSFSPDGSHLLTVTNGDQYGAAVVWTLQPPDARPLPDLLLLAELLTGEKLDALGGMAPLDAVSLARAWRTLRGKYPHDLAPPGPAEMLAWQRLHAGRSETGQEWTAAVFHLGQVLAATPSDAALYYRRARAWAALKQWDRADADVTRAHGLPDRPRSPDTLATMSDLAQAYLAAGQAEKALPLIRDYVAGARKRGANNTDFAGRLALISLELLKVRRFAEAEPLLRECLAIRAKSARTSGRPSTQ